MNPTRLKKLRKNAQPLMQASEQGFALLVVLFFVLVIAASASFAVELGATAQRRFEEQALLSEGQAFQRAFQGYYDSTPPGFSHYPSKLEDLLLDPRYPDVRRYLRKISPDPLTGKLDWVLIPGLEQGIVGVRSAFHGKPIKKAGFDLEFKRFEKAESYEDWVFTAYATEPSAPRPTMNLLYASPTDNIPSHP